MSQKRSFVKGRFKDRLLVWLLNAQDSEPLGAFYAPYASRGKDHGACACIPLLLACGEGAFSRYHIEENIIGLIVRRYLVAAIKAYDCHVEVLALE
jgi:hypothetical protein